MVDGGTKTEFHTLPLLIEVATLNVFSFRLLLRPPIFKDIQIVIKYLPEPLHPANEMFCLGSISIKIVHRLPVA